VASIRAGRVEMRVGSPWRGWNSRLGKHSDIGSAVEIVLNVPKEAFSLNKCDSHHKGFTIFI
jgi:hypothetical protein